MAFTGEPAANAFLNDLESCPHAFLIACLLDRQTNADSVWAMPYKFASALGTFDIESLGALPVENWFELLKSVGHRRPGQMSEVLARGVHRVLAQYDGDAAAIWSDVPTSRVLVQRFRDFHGVGQKISTMAANILVRDFKIPLVDFQYIDVSADVHVLRVMERLELVPSKPDATDVIAAARQLHPEYPGVFDLILWQIGRDVCRPKAPRCDACVLAAWCPSRSVIAPT